MNNEAPLNMTANRVIINSAIVTTERAVTECYVCRGQGHTASCCHFATIHQSKLRPVWCGAAEQARRERWVSGGTSGQYPFQTSAPYAAVPNQSIEAEAQTMITFQGYNDVPETMIDDDETLDEEPNAPVLEVAEIEDPRRRRDSSCNLLHTCSPVTYYTPVAL